MRIISEPLYTPTVHEIVDPEGFIRLIFYVLIAYLADLEEQFKIAALDKSNCIHCMATTNEFGSPDIFKQRTCKHTLEAIAQVQAERGINADPYEFALGADKHRLGDVEFPFWESLPFMDICSALSLDLLHGFHKFFFDHVFQWNVNSLGEDEVDARVKSQVALVGARVFPKGVTHISQMSGKEHRALQAIELGVVANAPGTYNREVTMATRALLDLLYLAQLPSHTDRTLVALQTAYDEFHELKSVWIKNGARQGEKGNVIPHFNIPKLHNIGHIVAQIKAKGTADNYSTETIEHLHIDTLKELYQATNKKEWKKQTVRGLIRRDKIVDFGLWLDWRLKQIEASLPTIGETNNGHSAHDCPSQIVGVNTNGTGHQGMSTSSMLSAPIPSHPAPNYLSNLPFSQSTMPHQKNELERKRKRKTEEEKEEQKVKRILLSQETYGLLPHQDIALQPVNRMTVKMLQEIYGFSNFLAEYRASTYQATNPMDENTVVETWQSIWLIEEQRRFHPNPTWRRAQAVPPTKTEVAIADPVLYTKELDVSENQGTIRLKDCKVGRIGLIFRISTPKRNNTSTPAPTLVYLSAFLAISRAPEQVTQLYVVNKPERPRWIFLDARRIVRVCPLSPRFDGRAPRNVTPDTALDRYQSFYINKYFGLSDWFRAERPHPVLTIAEAPVLTAIDAVNWRASTKQTPPTFCQDGCVHQPPEARPAPAEQAGSGTSTTAVSVSACRAAAICGHVWPSVSPGLPEDPRTS
ncbi:hypothetical protein FRC08_000066 [Ceratobasidium sp. 394]|nr:hypothetical protein FRC08_000066 [Ceratobasidium sp. 394]